VAAFATAAFVLVALLVTASVVVSLASSDTLRPIRLTGGAVRRWSGFVLIVVGAWFLLLAVLPDPILGSRRSAAAGTQRSVGSAIARARTDETAGRAVALIQQGRRPLRDRPLLARKHPLLFERWSLILARSHGGYGSKPSMRWVSRTKATMAVTSTSVSPGTGSMSPNGQ
jgi:hypothetical protein